MLGSKQRRDWFQILFDLYSRGAKEHYSGVFLGCFLSDPHRFQLLISILTGLAQSSEPAITSFDCRFTKKKGTQKFVRAFRENDRLNLIDISASF
jgi:hypothetical protein